MTEDDLPLGERVEDATTLNGWGLFPLASCPGSWLIHRQDGSGLQIFHTRGGSYDLRDIGGSSLRDVPAPADWGDLLGSYDTLDGACVAYLIIKETR